MKIQTKLLRSFWKKEKEKKNRYTADCQYKLCKPLGPQAVTTKEKLVLSWPVWLNDVFPSSREAKPAGTQNWVCVRVCVAVCMWAQRCAHFGASLLLQVRQYVSDDGYFQIRETFFLGQMILHMWTLHQSRFTHFGAKYPPFTTQTPIITLNCLQKKGDETASWSDECFKDTVRVCVGF